METLFERLLRDVVEVLNTAPREIEKHIIEGLERIDSEMAEEIKKRMFVFDDIVLLSDQSIQKMLHKVQETELALAVHGAHPAARDKIFRNLSDRVATLLKPKLSDSCR
jgi:flagellar motor switch protein FliG